MDVLALIATRKGLFTLYNDMNLSAPQFAGVPVSMVLAGEETDHWYAALNHGHFGAKLHRSADRGASWTEASTPTYPKTTDAGKGDSLELIWSMRYARPGNSVALWAGTIPGGLFYSDDAGDSWSMNEALWQHKLQHQWRGGGYDHAGIHSIDMPPDNPQHLRIAVSCAGVWQSKDSGASWCNTSEGMRAAFMPPDQQFDPNIQDPHRMVQCQSQPDKLWVQHHNGIFRSIDGGLSWQEIEDVSPSVFGFTVAVHPQDGDTAWFVPGIRDECRMPVNGEFVVTRTRDGGKTFETLSKGLPTGFSGDLVYRHGLDIDTSGERLIMGSTTGNLWISNNQGDSWQCLSNYLPPIYAVSFLK